MSEQHQRSSEDQQAWEELYGPPAIGATYAIGATLFYDDNGHFENGEVLYVAAQNDAGEPDLRYIVSPAGMFFPTPVWPDQIITGM